MKNIKKSSVERHRFYHPYLLNGVRRIPDWFYGLAGCVNSTPWTDSMTGKSYLPGTLLFNPSNMDRDITAKTDDDDYLWNIQFDISWNPIGWNNFQRPGGTDMMMWNGEPVRLYPERPFPDLLFSDTNGDSTVALIGESYNVIREDPLGNQQTIQVIVNPDGSVTVT